MDRIMSAPVQIDLGNLAVGLATVLIAFITLFVSLKNIKSQNGQKVAELRTQWIAELRTKFSDFIGTVYSITNEVVTSTETAQSSTKLDQMHSDLMRLESSVTLFLNPKEALHSETIKVIGEIRGRLAIFSISSSKKLHDEIDDSARKLIENAQLILKIEWDRARLGIQKT